MLHAPTTQTLNPEPPRLPYLPALDGLRALAVLAVLLYHANVPGLPGGFLGVEMFFVISGYLITSLLLAEWSAHGRVDFKGFWLRRARRLFPALLALLVVVVGFVAIFLPAELASLRGDTLSTAGYVNNWYQVFSHKSYFESAGRPSLLRHMWSLAVEEQFYLVWPLLFSVLMGWLRPRGVLALALVWAAASSVWMAVLFQPNSDPSRVYYGTDTRAAGLLLGVALAFLWRPGQVISAASHRMLDAIGVAAFLTLSACCVLLNEFQPFLYRGGFALTAIATAELVAVAVHPSARLVPRALSWTPLRWIGVRSYGLYLWHFPVFMLTRPQLDVTMDGALLVAVRLALTVVIAEVSYRFVETPVRHGALGRAWSLWREANGAAKHGMTLRWAAAVLPIVALCSVLGVVLARAKVPPPPAYLAVTATKTNLIAPAESLMIFSSASPVVVIAPPVTNPPAPVPPQKIPLPAHAAPAHVSNDGVTGIGDSVMEGVAGELQRAFGTNTFIDADQGRLPWNTPAIVRNLHAAGKIHGTVILQTGNNGFVSAEVFAQIMHELKDARRIVVVNVKVPRRWEALNNKMLSTAVATYTNAVLVDWHAASAARPELFWKDGLHVRPEGARVYAEMIEQALAKP